MGQKTFQIRVCQNPECGLRYPWYTGQGFGERCPLCLGQTEAVLEHALLTESEAAGRSTESGPRLAVLLDNIRSAWNTGSILRSAEGFGFSRAYLCGITPRADHPDVRKTSLGAESTVAWSLHRNAVQLALQLKNDGHHILALEAEPNAIPLTDLEAAGLRGKPILLIVGSEVTGIDPGLLDLADRTVCLPMQGRKRSLNVAVAFGAAAYSLSSILRWDPSSGAGETGHR